MGLSGLPNVGAVLWWGAATLVMLHGVVKGLAGKIM